LSKKSRSRLAAWRVTHGKIRSVSNHVASIPDAGCRVLNIAHRGASGDFPENTLLAFEAAIAAGAAMCELDVQMSRDAVPMVIHDDTVDRTTSGGGAVATLTSAQIRTFDAGRHRGPGFAGQQVPTLLEVIRATRGRCALNIEIKDAGAVAPVCGLMRREELLDSAIVSSFNRAALAEALRIEPRLRVALLAGHGASAMLAAARELGAVAVNPRCDLVNERLCLRAHEMGLQVYVWTVDEPAVMRDLIAAGVDGIMTNYPARLAAIAST
jgi:glycerophosphoryl diester phosphodiesterase